MHLTALDILGDLRKRLRAHGDICHLAHATVPALRTPILGLGAVIFSRVAQHNWGWPQLWHIEVNPNTLIPKVLVQPVPQLVTCSPPHHPSLFHRILLLIHFYISFTLYTSHAAPEHRPILSLLKHQWWEMRLPQVGYSSLEVLPRRLFPLAEIAKTSQVACSVLLNHQNSLHVQNRFPTTDTGLNSPGAWLPERSPDL